jgi:hypothetical protein
MPSPRAGTVGMLTYYRSQIHPLGEEQMPTRTNRRHGLAERDDRQTHLQDPAVQARHMLDDTIQYLRDYAREKPENAALWCLGIGFVLGWKLKPW